MKLETAVRTRLGRLPTDLRKLYHETLNQKLDSYEEAEKLICEGALRLLLCLQEPLPTKDFVLALSYSTEKQDEIHPDNILDLCSDFVVIDDEIDVFRFAHLSVPEFLESRDGYEPERNNALAFECCLRYLSSRRVLDVVPTLRRYHIDFNYYASYHWLFHLYESSQHQFSDPLKNLTW